MFAATLSERAAVLRRRPLLVGEVAIAAVLFVLYDHIRGLAPTRRGAALANADDIVGLERALHLDMEMPFNVWVSAHHTLALASSWYYQLLHLGLTAVVLVLCYWRRPDLYRSARNALVVICALGLLAFWLYPVAPPRLIPGTGFIDTAVATGVASPTSSTTTPDPYAAMPSLHIAWAVWAGIVALLMAQRLAFRLLWASYPLVTALVVVGTGNHYLLDVAAGGALALSALAVTRNAGCHSAQVPGEMVRCASLAGARDG